MKSFDAKRKGKGKGKGSEAMLHYRTIPFISVVT